MCKDAGITESKTNHSLRATGASALFNAQVPEKLIKGVTGHKSSQALQLYERPTQMQEMAVSRVLTAGALHLTLQQEQQQQQHTIPSVQRQQELSAIPLQNTETIVSKSGTSRFMGSLFNGLNNCTINITPNNFTVNVQTTTEREADNCQEFDDLARQM